jgi:transcriptional regulator with XRE-family HTH domain
MAAIPHGSPLRWLIGTELARFRAEARLSLNAAADRSGVSRAKLNHLEMGRQHQGPDDITTLLIAYGASSRDIDRLTSLTARADDATWWAPWAAVIPDWLKTFVGLERLADAEFAFESTVISGLLQTPEYAAALSASSPRLRRDHVDRFVAFRIARAERLTAQDRPLQLHVVMTDAALRLAVGSEEVRRTQYQHLVEMARLPNVTLQVLRPEDGPHSALTGPFAILDFEAARSVCYVEAIDGATYLQEPDQVSTYRWAARDIEQVALGPEQSIAHIEAMAKQL